MLSTFNPVPEQEKTVRLSFNLGANKKYSLATHTSHSLLSQWGWRRRDFFLLLTSLWALRFNSSTMFPSQSSTKLNWSSRTLAKGNQCLFPSIHHCLLVSYYRFWLLQDKEMVPVQDDIIPKVIVKPQTDERVTPSYLSLFICFHCMWRQMESQQLLKISGG